MQDPTGQVCFGVACAHCVLVCTFFALLFAFIFYYCFFVRLGLLFGANYSFIDATINKLVMHYFLLFYFCNFRHVVTSVLRNYLFVCLLYFLFFTVVCVFACLPYFLQGFCALIHSFLLQNYSFLYYLFFAGSSRCRMLVLIVFCPHKIHSFCGPDLKYSLL